MMSTRTIVLGRRGREFQPNIDPRHAVALLVTKCTKELRFARGKVEPRRADALAPLKHTASAWLCLFT